MRFSIIALLVTSGCFHVTQRPNWTVVSVTDLADDETTLEGTADEFLALLNLDSEMPTTWHGGTDTTDTTASVFVQRGTGPAQWVDLVPSSITTRSRKSRGSGISTFYFTRLK